MITKEISVNDEDSKNGGFGSKEVGEDEKIYDLLVKFRANVPSQKKYLYLYFKRVNNCKGIKSLRRYIQIFISCYLRTRLLL